MIKPTVGRVLLFFPSFSYLTQRGMEHTPGQPMAATVAYVHNERLVNLSVVDHDGNQFGVREVPLIQEGEPLPADSKYHAEWMPYQVKQASKDAEGAPIDSLPPDSARGLVQHMLPAGATIKVDGIPLALDHPALVWAHPSNIKLINQHLHPACNAGPAE